MLRAFSALALSAALANAQSATFESLSLPGPNTFTTAGGGGNVDSG